MSFSFVFETGHVYFYLRVFVPVAHSARIRFPVDLPPSKNLCLSAMPPFREGFSDPVSSLFLAQAISLFILIFIVLSLSKIIPFTCLFVYLLSVTSHYTRAA
jgi:hypothetical protein